MEEKIYRLTKLADELFNTNRDAYQVLMDEANSRMEKIGFEKYNAWLCENHKEEVIAEFEEHNGYAPSFK